MRFWIALQRVSAGTPQRCTPYLSSLFCILFLGVSHTFAAKKLENRTLGAGKIFKRDYSKRDRSLFYVLKPFQIMIMGAKKPMALFHIEVILETPSHEAHKELEEFLPHVYSALFEDFYGIAPFLWGTGYTPDLMSLKIRATRICKRLLKESLINDVLVQRAFVKPLLPPF